MEIKNINYILSVLITIFALTSCDKEELNVVESQTTLKQSILTFSTQEEFTNTMDKVNAMSKVQRLNWEKEQGFKSFGTICDEFYEKINPEQFKSIEEVKLFVSKNADKIELYTSSDGEIYCVVKDFRNTKRYLINRDKEYKIGVTTYKEEGDNQAEKYSVINSLGLQKANAAIVTSDEIIDENKIGSDTYRMHIWIDTYNYYDTSVYVTFLKNELKLSNFARWLAIWWERTYSTDYRITLKTTDGAYGLLTAGNGSNTITEDIKSKYILNSYNYLPIGGGSIFTNPRLVSYTIYAKNAKGCVIDQSKTY